MVDEGGVFKKNQKICKIHRNFNSLLTGERIALNFLQTLSGTATITRTFVNKIKTTSTILLDTRKTLPGLRIAQKYAVKIGGELISDPALIYRHTAAAWCPTFSKTEVCGEVGARLLEEFPPTLNWRLTKTLCKEDFKRLLDIIKDSGVGKDGLPYSSWRASNAVSSARCRGLQPLSLARVYVRICLPRP